MTLGKMIAVILLLFWWGPPPILAQPGLTGDSSPIAGLNKLFEVGDQWALYGAPQPGAMSSADWDVLVRSIRNTSFALDLVQVVVITRDSDVDGTIGLVDRRKGRRISTMVVGQSEITAYDIWREVGYRTTARRIYTEHKGNALAIDRYREMPVILSSRVRRVASDLQGSMYVELSVGSNPADGALLCYPWAGAPQLVDPATLTEGEVVKVTCQISSFSDGMLKMTSCLFDRQELLKGLF